MAKKKLTLRNGYWSKKVRGKIYYFGKDYEKALSQWQEQELYLKAGITKDDSDSSAKVDDLLNEFLSDRLAKVHLGELSSETYQAYESICHIIAECLPLKKPLKDLKASDFIPLRKRLARGKNKKQLSLKSHDRSLGYARAVFRFASIDNYLIDRPLPFTRALTGVPKREMRKYRAAQPPRLIPPEAIRYAIKEGNPKLSCMVLLAINGGFNNRDIAMLELKQFKPMPEVLDYPRRKTYFPRKTPLWPETKEAISTVISQRPKTRKPHLLISKVGTPYDKTHKGISDLFRATLKAGEHYQAGRNFGALRTTFAEVGREVGDDLALKALMGHSDGSQLYESYASGVYLPRLQKVTDHVREWLFKKC